MKKFLFALIFAVLALFVSLAANVYFHELGHFAAASFYGLEPEVSFISLTSEASLYSLNSEALAYTTYAAPSSVAKDFIITIAGPLVNILFTAAFYGLYRLAKAKDNFILEMTFVAVTLTSVLSVVTNLIPVIGSDGYVLRSLL
jgi:Zn-dependent protease